ncbi:MAG: S8 family serine peptidase, partial [Myxococcota bacterium]
EVSTLGLELDPQGEVEVSTEASAFLLPVPAGTGVTKSPGLVLVDVFLEAEVSPAFLRAEGLELVSRSGRRASGWIPESELSRVRSLPGVEAVERSERLKTSAQSLSAYVGAETGILNQAVAAHGLDAVRDAYKLDGKGVEICIISTSYDLLGGASASVAAGDLPGVGNPNYPTPVQVVAEGDEAFFAEFGTDEGRAMAELIHDLAPAAKLVFHGITTVERDLLAQAIRRLREEAACDIIVDDVVPSVRQPFFQPDESQLAVREATDAGIVYVTSAGNEGRGGFERGGFRLYEDDYRPVEVDGLRFHDFDPGPEEAILLQIQPEAISPALFDVLLQWDEPWGSLCDQCPGRSSDLGIVLLGLVRGSSNFTVIGTQWATNSQDARTLYFQGINGLIDADFFLGLIQRSTDTTTPTRIKLAFLQDDFRPVDRSQFEASPLWSYRLEESAVVVGASAWFDTPRGAELWNQRYAGQPGNDGQLIPVAAVPPVPLLSFEGLGSLVFRTSDGTPLVTASSVGGAQRFFDEQGQRLAQPLAVQKPDVVAATGTETSFFASEVTPLSGRFFFGTSASAPHVAGVAALLIQASQGQLTPDEVQSWLESSATDMDDPFDGGLQRNASDPGFASGFDFSSGFGFVEAEALLRGYIESQSEAPVGVEYVCTSNGRTQWEVDNPNGFGVTRQVRSFGATLELPEGAGAISSGPTWVVPPGRSTIVTVPRFSSDAIQVRGGGQFLSRTLRGRRVNCPLP